MAQSSTEGSSSSKSLLWMMVALVCALGILFGVGIDLSSRVLSSMARPAGANLTVHTPIADLRVEKPNEIGPGLPLYPHAALLLSGTNTAGALPHPKHAQSQMTTYYTDDVPPLVDSWYLQHLSGEFARHQVGEPQAPPEVDEVPAPIDSIVFLGQRGDQIRMVTLTSNSTGTRITLVRFTKSPTE